MAFRIRKGIRHAYIRVKPPDGRVVVSVPRRMSESEINSLIAEREDWIRKHQKKYDKAPESYEFGSIHKLWGEDYVLACGKERVAEDERVMYITAPTKEACDKLRRSEMKRMLDHLVPLWMEKTGIRVNEWRVRDMSTRWGSCNILEGRIWLALNLSRYPLCCLEQTICHELVHMRVKDHGSRFKALMDEYYPNWREVKKMMR